LEARIAGAAQTVEDIGPFLLICLSWLFRIVKYHLVKSMGNAPGMELACTFKWPSFHVQEAISSVKVKDETWNPHQWLSNPRRLKIEPRNPVLQYHCVRCGREELPTSRTRCRPGPERAMSAGASG
jgi:hypothetical protein